MISVIIPTYNEEKALPATLERLFGERVPCQVILVDGGSTDRTRETTGAYPSIQILSAPKGRASQMNAGAALARGDWLLFLHADTLLPEGALTAIEAMGPEIQAGGFRHRFSGAGASLRLISLLDNLRSRSTRIIYGDQAMFVRRGLFHALGGFPDQPMLEDVAFCERLVRVTRPVMMKSAVITDSRKFVKMGVWRSLARVLVILACVELRLPIPGHALRFFQDVR
jgi:rSAM/selenodomain-associated transferase 2